MTIRAGDFRKKHADGHNIGQDFADGGFPQGLHVGILVRIDEFAMKGDVKVLTRGGQIVPEIDLTVSMCGPRSFWGGVPEINSIVVLAYRQRKRRVYEPMILAYIPVGNKGGMRFDPWSPTDPKAVPTDPAARATYDKFIGRTQRHKKMKLKPGNVGGMSSDGAEFLLAKDVRMTNRAGDLIELRDAERTLVTQAIHRFDSTAGCAYYSGPVRRGENYLPSDIFSKGRTLKTEKERYFGSDELKALGPGDPGSVTKFANSSGVVLDFFNDYTNYPPTTYSNGKRVFYPSTVFGTSIEDGEEGGGFAFTEDRMEMIHDTDLIQDVINEIDGFSVTSPGSISRRRVYIERVYGTVIGNDSQSTQGMRVYGKVVRPELWSSFRADGEGTFSMGEVGRAAQGDTDTNTAAAAFLFRIWCPYGSTDDNAFSMAIEKQGKVYLHVPKPTSERYLDDSGVSVEANLLGALKLYIGASNNNNTSIQASLAGGIVADIGRNKDTGNCLDLTFHGSVSSTYTGLDGEVGYAKFDDIQASYGIATGGDMIESIGGAKNTVVNGQLSMQADRVTIGALQGLGMQLGQLDVLVAQKSQYNYALGVLETVVAVGKVTTILLGGQITNIFAGGEVTNIAAGGSITNIAAGGYVVSVLGGAISLTAAAGAVAMTAGLGVSVTAGLSMSLTAGLGIAITAPGFVSVTSNLIILGGPSAVLGVCRGVPSLPPGTPTLDPITGIPLFGALLVLSN